MSDAPDPAKAHREEIFEALMDAAFKGDADSFSNFNQEWERIDPLDGSGYHIRFGDDPPRRSTTNGHCFHCGSAWEVNGIVFGAMVPGLARAIHMNTECPEQEDCTCWSELPDETNTLYHPLCQVCEYPLPLCGCDEGIALGPCALARLIEREVEG